MTRDLVLQPADAMSTFGFVVLRQFFDPGPLAAEIDKVLADGILSDVPHRGDIRFQYVPMMTAETPVSLSLLDRAEAVAVAVFGGPVIPTRAKGSRYHGESPWHTDSDLSLRSVGFLAYLEPVGADSGALRVIPGSHHPQFSEALRGLGATGLRDPSLPAHVVATEPGDIVLLDERVLHASFGGGSRRQWRVDYLGVPADTEVELTKSYFASIYSPDWDGGYDVDRYPSYGRDWRQSSRVAVAQLEAFGVYELASAQEAFMCSRRGTVRSLERAER
jgi:hypothetical protein